MNVAHFGEIVELDSRAVWYSDEEDDDDSIDDDLCQSQSKAATLVDSISHETFRSNVNVRFRPTQHSFPLNIKFTSCIISQASSAQFKNFKLDPNNLIGYIDNIGKAIVYPIAEDHNINGNILWLLFDSSAQFLAQQEVAYFVEKLRELLYNEFNLDHSCPIIVLSQQFSSGEHLEFLINYPTNDALLKLPFQGCQIRPPSLVRNQFESALFEQLTLTVKPALVICLPNPKNYWFDQSKSWPTVPDKIIELRLSDDHLEKTLIFT